MALKLIKTGMDSRAVLARFDAERQALALMDHPNIARVLDGGATAAGQPFFVMELVKGVPITEYCDQQRLTPRERLELFVPVCQAVQHAHQKGIIHRDIKPSNVLVAEVRRPAGAEGHRLRRGQGDRGSRSPSRRLATGFGAIVGTPAYMSPEQADLSTTGHRHPHRRLCARRDALRTAGRLAADRREGSSRRRALLEMLRMVREVEPPRPSTKLSTADALPSIAANRGIEPAKLTGLLRGELDWIVMKALEKDRTRRYETANGLARDIQRYLADELVEARPPSAVPAAEVRPAEQGAGAAAAAVGLVLTVGLVGTVAGLARAVRAERLLAEEARRTAEREREERERDAAAERRRKEWEADSQATPIIAILETVWTKPGNRGRGLAGLGGDTRTTLLAAPAGAERLAGQPAAGRVWHALAMAFAHLGEYPVAEQYYRRAIEIRERALGPEAEETLDSRCRLGEMYYDQGRLAEAEPQLREVLDRGLKNFGRDSGTANSAAACLVRVLRDQERLAEAEAVARDHLRRVRSVAPAGHIWLAEPLENLGWVLTRLGKYGEAEPVLREALALREQYGPPGSGVLGPSLAEDQFGNRVLLGLALAGQKKYAEAGPLLETGYRGVREFGWAGPAVPPPVLLSEAAARLAELYTAAGDPGEAARWRAGNPREQAPPPREVKR